MTRKEELFWIAVSIAITIATSLFNTEIRTFLSTIPQGYRKARIAYLKMKLDIWGTSDLFISLSVLTYSVVTHIGFLIVIWSAAIWLTHMLPGRYGQSVLDFGAPISVYIGLDIYNSARWALSPAKVKKAKATLVRLRALPATADEPSDVAEEHGLLTLSTPTVVGLGRTDFTSIGIFARNTEDRYSLPAHNLTANLRLHSFSGEELTSRNVPWFYPRSNKSAQFVDTVTLGMSEHAAVLLAMGNDEGFYIPTLGASGVEPGQPLSYGQWDVTLEIKGDNFKGRYATQLKLTKGNSFTPSVVNTIG